MTDSTTIVLLAALALTAGSIYMFNPNAKAAKHSQPKFTQMNKPGDYFKPPMTSSESDNSLKAKPEPIFARLGIMTGRTFLG